MKWRGKQLYAMWTSVQAPPGDQPRHTPHTCCPCQALMHSVPSVHSYS